MSAGVPILAGLGFFALVFGGLWFLLARMRKKRIAKLASWAQTQGWTYTPDDQSLVALSEGEPFRQGHSRTAQDVFNGSIGGHDFVSFQYSYKVTTGSGEQQSTQTYEFMVTAIVTPPSSYRLEIKREGVFAGLARAVGFTDLEFESDEFNKKFKIKATPERFAYDVLNPRTMERMLADQRYSQPLRFENGRLLTWRRGKLDEQRITGEVQYLIDTLEPVPAYAWEQH
ncbi:DUF3137 domain-containing protein [Mycobacteroides franklinii]|uniref:DUF3137 domain-containing protein n=1 Tax=Mycobacteroides franklinii TaxID=948102 RepID=A0A4R8R5W4_9MYCO|nr:DUF3137 domain-containing protein [Mycobacteroides franklinii]ORA64689.1 hypothetical protein BST24_01370 [Mycobacteroides franklinii]TDH22577.1 hypothetical protein EJ571_11790 [Mycobacteroides franklinii]TDZ44231.1 hypothetical protein CCUG64054_04296 [Mycobacteroides franklinii]TDZ51364.1 hypothetical protein CCUG63697_02880 [Mycobacteroides franklinii]TDZ57785.1 hypothetical protein CCUG63696_04292 [Mycobacteroides franklinii]